MSIEKPEISWQNHVPYSLIFKDIYFSSENGLKETMHVFIKGNDLIHRWKNLKNPVFTIIETGFGTGLNFCTTAKTFLENSQGLILNYISIEKYPLSRDDIQKALGIFPEIKNFSEKLICNYPARTKGIHRLNIDKQICLTLVFEDRIKALQELYLNEGADAWFLDGFSPSKNEEMWSEDLILQIAEHSKINTTLSTYTCAGHVRRKLQSSGFDVTKMDGFGKKRQMITAKMNNEPVRSSKKLIIKPWYYLRNKNYKNKNITIIGAGLSGCAVADAFAKRNWNVSLIDQNKDICSEASGNPLGIFFPVIHRKPTFTSRFSTMSYFYLLRHLKVLVNEGYQDLLHLHLNGLLQVVENARELDRFTGDTDKNCLDEFYRYFDKETLKKKFNLQSEGGVFFKDAGYLSPAGLCEANLKRHEQSNPINRIMNHKAGRYKRESDFWVVYDEHDKVIARSEVLVLANSWAINDFDDTKWLKLQKIRGQLVKPEINIQDFNIPVSARTYIIPDKEGMIIGATHDRFDDAKVHFKQNLELLQNTYEYFPDLEHIIQDLFLNKFTCENKNEAVKRLYSRVSFRSAADDHFPVIGRLPAVEYYNKIFSDLRDGETNYYHKNGYAEQPLAWRENLYCLTGCGSRGILYSQYGAELIASMANFPFGEVLPVEKDIFEALSPARFLFRKLKQKVL
ncbi:MAG: bifunctional tRNA (5-methylaminomethyl-2-thiouridine)(34)-methyltransferase MnmD/FAD-dependent 5-carboxymethylaminomethyl-2-thiouridine(34) oxidoreductase MnmC [Spirochaetia bacterium]|nr:bifunctional tRNA (5-methylaminomethyl-2-thiouridine)(34)-methyltransferase MnmD/FAD-dependent 5-carboxymethylaminomethyl-2-thiouridine(34) oxidoreductase MnmC [Spirochaetia bacterium]